MSSPGGHLPIVCFFAPSHGSHCQWCIAHLPILFRLVVDPKSSRGHGLVPLLVRLHAPRDYACACALPSLMLV